MAPRGGSGGPLLPFLGGGLSFIPSSVLANDEADAGVVQRINAPSTGLRSSIYESFPSPSLEW